MPLFRSSSPQREAPPPQPESPPSRSRGLFGRRSNSLDNNSSYNGNGYNNDYDNTNNSTRTGSTRRSGGGLFGRRRSSSTDSDRSFDLKKDPSIRAARQKVTEAEAAEAAADRALNDARSAVRTAKDHVRRLEQEALEEARRAKAKQAEAKTIKKSTGRLGRHG
ncbi:hypothetical protein GY45DRAFT_1431148 [Cubamyces sp. BRFM 1775]|nr:hypothetical protein GY45DRAFT_1431148 [Cubamyces sp. BRFM 1775]